MDRRAFFRTMISGVAAASAVRTWPFRVYSFPTDIVVAPNFDAITAATLASLRDKILYDNFFVDTPLLSKLKRRQTGMTMTPFQFDSV